jgi:GTPase
MKTFALVGKPNVGKSTFFNRLAGKRLAIVDERPGITRDRNTAIVRYHGYRFILIDTGGFEPTSKEAIPQKMLEQSQLAIEEADGIIFLLDKTTGWTPQDQEIYRRLRIAGKPVYLTVNKIDDIKHESATAEFYESGTDVVFPVSAAHGRGIISLLEAIATDFPTLIETEAPDAQTDMLLSIAVVGRPNAGKSSLVNHFIGQHRQIVDESPGTTRDPIDNLCRYHGQTIRLIDTAGLRRKSRVSQLVDQYSMVAALKSIERADVVLLIIDANEGVVEQDARIAGHVLDRGRALIIVVNKWDLLVKDHKTMERTTQLIRDQLRFLDFAPILFVSAKTGQRVPLILEKAITVYGEYTKRIQTANLNQILQDITARHEPPARGRNKTKLFYATQVSTCPPTIVISVNAPNAINPSYQRFLSGQLRHYFGFEGTPIRILWRDRSMKHPLEAKKA